MGPSPAWLDQRLLFFTGKGGTGKSTVAAAAALFAAQHGKRVLVVDVDAKQTVADQFEHKPVGFIAERMHLGVDAMAMDTEQSLREYLKLNLRIPVIGRVGPIAHMFDFVATAAPGVREILTIGKIAWEVRESIARRSAYDMVIVDAVASGHVIAHLNAARTIRDLADVGPLRHQTDWMIELLEDPNVTSVNIVTTPEEMPVAETIELGARLKVETKVPIGSIVVNRVLPELFTLDDERVFNALQTDTVSEFLMADYGPLAASVFEGARLAVELRRSRSVHLERLRGEVPPSVGMLYLPYQFGSLHGLRMTTTLAQALSEELL